MQRSRLLLCFALALPVFFGSSAESRESAVCDPPVVSIVSPGQTFNGIICRGPWGCSCAARFCAACSTELWAESCSLAKCRNLPPPHHRVLR